MRFCSIFTDVLNDRAAKSALSLMKNIFRNRFRIENLISVYMQDTNPSQETYFTLSKQELSLLTPSYTSQSIFTFTFYSSGRKGPERMIKLQIAWRHIEINPEEEGMKTSLGKIISLRVLKFSAMCKVRYFQCSTNLLVFYIFVILTQRTESYNNTNSNMHENMILFFLVFFVSFFISS